MRISFLRGPFLNPWELQSYAPLALRHDFTAVGAHWKFYRPPFSFPGMSIVPAHVWGESLGTRWPNAGVFFNRAMSWTVGQSYGFYDLERVTRGAEVLHAAELHFTMSDQCLKIKRRRGTPFVVTVWENILHQGETHPIRRRRKKAVIQEADGFLAVTPTTAAMLKQEGVDPKKIWTIPMSVDTQRFSPVSKDAGWMSKLGLSSDDFVVLFIGRFVEEKGIEDLLAAAQLLSETTLDRPIRFCFVGAGPMEPALRSAQARFPKQIIIHPFAPYEEIPRLHNVADIFVLPSRPAPKWQEQFGYVLAESMACGKPVISTRSGSIPDVVGDAGLLVMPSDPQALSAEILRLARSDEDRRLLGQRARAWALEQFNAATNATKIEAMYQTVIGRR
jgi:alpha-maltose-1-phosphate synthase